ncbi:SecDF P1 head subdomain-containing protein [Prosthecobacter sp.]|uniref:SecDF P1 head subdomain-containing protein n=1 Tax=Prosthecobacter sp. TaxID=1965333 RepID=UPI0037833415
MRTTRSLPTFKRLLLLLATLLLPASMLAENVMEMRYVLQQEEPGAIKAKFKDETLWLSPEIVVSDPDVIKAFPTVSRILDNPSRTEWAVSVRFSPEGAERFDAQADKHFGEQLAILINGKVISAPIVRARKFSGSVEISGNSTQKEAEDLATALQPKPQEKP